MLTPLSALHGAFLTTAIRDPSDTTQPARLGRDLLAAGGEPDPGRLRSLFMACVTRLEAAGLVKHLAFGDLVLLQPELLDVYAGAVVNAARAEPDGLGSLWEETVLAADFAVPLEDRVNDPKQEKLLVIATVEELTRHEIVLGPALN